MAAALACLGVGLQAEAEIVQQRADQGAADPVALGLQLVGEPAQALAGPAQRRFRIAARGRPDQGLESRPQLRFGLDRGLPARPRPTQPARRQRALVGQVLEPAPDGARRQAGDLSHCRDAAIAGGLRFGGGPQAAPPLVEKGLQRFVALPDAVAINHPDRGRPASGATESLPGHSGGDQSPRRASGSRSVATKPQSIPQPEARSLPLNHSIRSFADGPLVIFFYGRVRSVRSTNAAAASASASRPNGAITCTPTGMPCAFSRPGTLAQGVPMSVHTRLKRAFPVLPKPSGAAPGAENVRSTSASLKASRRARRA